MNDRAGITSTSHTSYEEMKQTALKRDEEQVKSFIMVFSVPISLQIPLKLPDVCLMENSPFSKADFISAGSSSISSIYTGIMHATREVQDSLLSAVNEGEKKCRNFVKSALSVGQSVNFYSPISKSKLKTIEHMNAKTSLKCKSGEIITGHIKWASISKGSIMVSFKWFTIAWTYSSSRFKAVCFISSCEVLLVLVIPALLLKKASFPLDKHPAASMVFGAIWALKKPS
jgi:hypothetical protein